MLELTDSMREDIIKRAAILIAKMNAPKALLCAQDIAAICGIAIKGSSMQNMLASKDFPRPVMIGKREKRWYSGEVIRWLDAHQF